MDFLKGKHMWDTNGVFVFDDELRCVLSDLFKGFFQSEAINFTINVFPVNPAKYRAIFQMLCRLYTIYLSDLLMYA